MILKRVYRKALTNFNKGSSSLTLNRSGYTGKRNKESNTSYPCMKAEFPRWEDGYPTSWIFRAEKFFRFHRTLEESKVKITSIQLDGDAI
ncbi:hypothetical protein B296_00021736 [Ensete ventricosum]|uniref:Uncharacterized protein n=1 Tax=Ensete ventricosum TaxID=4639 RepID=A0A427AAT4_ENSVE|nr:hypothetical protein B296_00021736 [Ensete ventricosum]